VRHPQSANTDTKVPAVFDGRLALSINEAARALNVDRDTIYRLTHTGQLTLSKIGRRSVIHVASIVRLLQDTITVPKARVRDESRCHALVARAEQVPHARRRSTL
jgi:excisionase family DNA binding protein